MTVSELLQVIGPIVGGFMGVGGVGAYYAYKGQRPKSDAEARKSDADVVATFADGWKNYSIKLEARLDASDREIANLKKAIEEQDERNREIIQEKDSQISALQEKNRRLEVRIDDLEIELNKYKITPV